MYYIVKTLNKFRENCVELYKGRASFEHEVVDAIGPLSCQIDKKIHLAC
jgi:hypothetical protein